MPPPGTGYAPPPYAGFGGAPAGPPPDNYLVWAILATVLCSCTVLALPFGIISIVYSTQVNTKWNAGDVAGAQNSSKKALQFAIVSGAVGLVLYGISFLVNLANGSFNF
jgi:hypothetical protein